MDLMLSFGFSCTRCASGELTSEVHQCCGSTPDPQHHEHLFRLCLFWRGRTQLLLQPSLEVTASLV